MHSTDQIEPINRRPSAVCGGNNNRCCEMQRRWATPSSDSCANTLTSCTSTDQLSVLRTLPWLMRHGMLHGVRLANGFFRPGSGIHDGSMMQQMAFAPASVIDVTKAGPMLLCGLEGIGGLVPYPMQHAK
jgi:hypothetical protein